MRQLSKQRLTIGCATALLLCLWPSFSFATGTTGSDVVDPTDERNRYYFEMYVTDPLTGSAIEGMDPVSYFTEPEPLMGKAEYEYHWKGVSWFFATEANREVFKKAPEAYVPQFGGYGLAGLARGYLSTGNPRIYAVYNRRLYLFYSSGNREAFMLEKAAMVNFAFKNWENLRAQLARR